MASRPTVSPQKVLPMGHRLQVARVDASWNATEVIEFKALGDRPDEKLVGDAMGINLPLRLTIPDVSVAEAAASESAHPQPTPGIRLKLDLVHESIQRVTHGH